MHLRHLRRTIILGMAVALSAVVGISAAGAGDVDDESVGGNPIEHVVESLAADSSELNVDNVTGDICVATRLGRASGSACTAADADEILVMYTMSVEGNSIVVFDPTQRAVSIAADGLEAVLQHEGDLEFFTISAPELPDRLDVLDAKGAELASFTPSADRAMDLAQPEGPDH